MKGRSTEGIPSLVVVTARNLKHNHRTRDQATPIIPVSSLAATRTLRRTSHCVASSPSVLPTG